MFSIFQEELSFILEQESFSISEQKSSSTSEQQSSISEQQSSFISEQEAFCCPICCCSIPQLSLEKINAVTSCEHVYCYECAMRLLFVSNRKHCPICRENLNKMVLTRKPVNCIEQIREVNSLNICSLKWFSNIVYYDDESILQNLDLLLRFRCCNLHKMPIVKKASAHFNKLSKMIYKAHQYYICDLCFFNLELLPIEYQTFITKQNLIDHKCGEVNNILLESEQVKHFACDYCKPQSYYFDFNSFLNHLEEHYIYCEKCSERFLVNRDFEHHQSQHLQEEANFASRAIAGNSRRNTAPADRRNVPNTVEAIRYDIDFPHLAPISNFNFIGSAVTISRSSIYKAPSTTFNRFAPL